MRTAERSLILQHHRLFAVTTVCVSDTVYTCKVYPDDKCP